MSKEPMPLRPHRQRLEALYETYNDPAEVHPDPLEFVHRYDAAADREVVALVASCLAYGRVEQILRSVSAVLDSMGDSPARYLLDAGDGRLRRELAGFRHRFSDGWQLACLLRGAKEAIARYGSLHKAFASGPRTAESTIMPALARFTGLLRSLGGECGHLLPDPAAGSACKRLNLMLRWMVRRDRVDIGDWSAVRPAALLVPLDTHMHRIGLELGLTRRRSADLAAAEEVTAAFRAISPDDPVKYDFALTHLAMRGFLQEGSVKRFLFRPRAAGRVEDARIAHTSH